MSHSSSSLEPQTQTISNNNSTTNNRDIESSISQGDDDDQEVSSPNSHPRLNSPLLTQNLNNDFNDINNNRRDVKNSNEIGNISPNLEKSEESDNKNITSSVADVNTTTTTTATTTKSEIELVVENVNESKREDQEVVADDDYELDDDDGDHKQPATTYKLRACLATDADSDWIRAPQFFDEEQISQLTNEQIKTTLDYFILSGYRVSQMTKTYYDIEAVTKLLDEKEKDLELAATIGKQLLEKDQQLEVKIEYLELELEKTTEMVNQLRYEITLKDNLLKSFIDSEADGLWDEQNEIAQKKKLNEINAETLSEYKRKISHLESENEMLRTRAEFFEHETTDLESKESYLLENCIKELENSQSTLRDTQEELSAKTAECNTQQEEINSLFSQIFELQLKIKTLSQTNSDLKSNYETSTSEIINELNELKQKYNECLKQLNKTQEELILLRKKTNTTPTPTSVQNRQTSTTSILASMKSLSTAATTSQQQQSGECDESSFAEMMESSCATGSRITAANSNSFATELFCSLARDYRTKNLYTQASQSSAFVRKVKEKLVRQIPGSNIATNDQLQSDSEAELFNCSLNNTREMLEQIESMTGGTSINTPSAHRPNHPHHHHNHYHYQYHAKFTNCPTPDSVLSTGSASIYSSLVKSSSSGFMLPEKLQIVKPIEGSQTLQHWQYLATPNLGCLFEERPGVRVVKGTSPHDLFNLKKSNNINEPNPNDTDEGLYEFTEYDDFCTTTDQFDEDEDDEDVDNDDAEVDEYFRRSSSSAATAPVSQYDHQSIYNQRLESSNSNNKNTSNNYRRVLSPSKVEMLTRLLEREEQQQQQQETEQTTTESEELQPGIFGFIKRYFSSGAENKEIETTKTQQTTKTTTSRSHRHECDDPDTPPSSPVNLPAAAQNNNILVDVFNSAKSYFSHQSTSSGRREKTAPTPPATPTQEIEHGTSGGSKASFYSFFDQIVNRLGSSFSNNNSSSGGDFKAPLSSSNKKQTSAKSIVDFSLDEDFHQEEKELVDLEMQKELKTRLCSTPPPSPSKFSPPLPELHDQNDEYNEEQIKKSAFVKVASLNPYLNLNPAYINNNTNNTTTNTVDLASLLGSLGSLKRSQRF